VPLKGLVRFGGFVTARPGAGPPLIAGTTVSAAGGDFICEVED
jgi:hypothetical protein